jgi:glycosyltransferase involved in cell wall biosynthesis
VSELTIMIIAPSAYTLGGVQTWLDYLMPGLRQLGWRVVLGLVSGRYHDVNAYLAVHPYDRAIPLVNATGSGQGRIDAIAKAVRAVGPDIVMVVNIIDVYAAILRLKKQSGGLPRVVATLHGLQSDFICDAKSYGGIVDGVICTNRLLQELIRDRSEIEPGRVLYAPYGVEIPGGLTLSKNTQELITLAYVGRLERPQKRFHEVIEIFERALRNGLRVKLIVAGEGPEMNWFVGELEARGMSDHVDVLGELDQKDLAEDVYKVADALLITSSWETGPIVAWEAMAHGLVVISSKFIGSGKEGGLVEGCNCLMFDSGDIDSAVECITQLEDAKFRETLINNALSAVGNKYSRSKSIETWAEQLRTVMRLTPVRKHEWRIGSPRATGRLDRVLGVRIGEWVRKILGREFVHQEAGSEWAHTYVKIRDDDAKFLISAASADRR